MPDLDSTLDAIDAATGCQQCEGPLGDSPSSDFCGAECQSAYFAARSVPLVGYREPYDVTAHYSNQRELVSEETTPCPCGSCRALQSIVVRRATPAYRSGLAEAERVQVSANEWLHIASAHGCEVRWLAQGDRQLWARPLVRSEIVGVELVDEHGQVMAYQFRPRREVVSESSDEITYRLNIETSRFNEAIRTATASIGQFIRDVRPVLDPLVEASTEIRAGQMQRALDARRNRNTGPQWTRRAPRRVDPRGSR